jgi:hypothetical protein
MEHLARKLGQDLTVEAARLKDRPDRISAAVDVLWARYSTPLFDAWLELWVAARTDEDLRKELAPLERRLREAVAKQVHELFGQDHQVDMTLRLTVYVLQGMAVERSLGMAPKRSLRSIENQILAMWKSILGELIERRTPSQ